MLIDVHKNMTEVTQHPHADHLRAIHKQAGDVRFAAMMDALDKQVHGKEVSTSSWMPPKGDWRSTEFAPLVELAGDDLEFSGRLFGCVVWQHFMERPERWGFGRFEKNGTPIGGITYFQIGLAMPSPKFTTART